MTFGERLQFLRRKSDISQSELAKKVGTSGTIIGKYERNSITPSVEVAKKIAHTFDISIDYLVGNTDYLPDLKDKNILKLIADIDNLPEEYKEHVFFLINSIVRDAKAKKVYAK